MQKVNNYLLTSLTVILAAVLQKKMSMLRLLSGLFHFSFAKLIEVVFTPKLNATYTEVFITNIVLV